MQKKPVRKSISKKIRFEVFKRDSFTCQYCGRKAPDVILNIDHIIPVCDGGTNSITNLITSCESCNNGKSGNKIDDKSVAKIAQKQAEENQEKRNQIKMIAQWHIDLAKKEEMEVDAVNDLYEILTNNTGMLSQTGRESVKRLIKKFGLQEVLESLREGTAGYKNPKKALEKLGGICANRSDPILRKKGLLYHILSKKSVDTLVRWKVYCAIDECIKIYGEEFLDRQIQWANITGNHTSLVIIKVLETISKSWIDAYDGEIK